MAEKDILSKIYMENPNRFSDVINFLLYDGKEVIKPYNLKSCDTTIKSLFNEKLTQKFRDLLKEVEIKEDDKNTYAIIGIENQSSIDKYMLIRNMLYDSLTYYNQINIDKRDKNVKIKVGIKPVITIVIYYGLKRWNGPKELHNMLNINNENILKFIPNYKMNLISFYELTDDEINKFKSEIKILAKFINKSNDKYEFEKLMNIKEINKCSNETILMINKFLDMNLKIDNNMEVSNMCKAWEELKKDYKEEGIALGKEEGIALGKEEAINENVIKLYNKGQTIETISDLLDIDINKVKRIVNC